jgi:CheY-like chemotaxis protein
VLKESRDCVDRRGLSTQVMRVWQTDETTNRPSVRGRSLRVLVADDNQIGARTLSILVTMWGHDVRTVFDGATALELALAFEPDVLLLDISMPEMDGCRVASVLRRRSRFIESLLIAISGHAGKLQRLLCEAAGFDLVLLKPVTPSLVETLLLLERTRLNRKWFE